MKKFLLALLLVAVQSVAFASVTAVKWGEDANKVLRLVFDLSEPTKFEWKIENKKLSVEVNAPFEGNNRLEPIRSIYAKHMTVAGMGSKTVVELPLSQDLTADDIKTFTLKQDPVTNRPSRIVVDISKRVVSTALVAQAPEAIQKPLPVVQKPSSVVQVTPAPQVSVSSSQAAGGAKVNVGSMPTNKSEAQARATQRGKEAVEAILGRVSKGTYVPPGKSASVPADVETKKAPVITDSVPVVQIVTPSKPAKQESVKTGKNKQGEYRTKGGIKGKIITIDPGHGGSDPGAVSDKNTYEKTITLSMAQKLKADLESMGATVYLTRTGDTDVARPYADDEEELQARVDVAEKRGSDLFISLHINASVNRKASGISTYYFQKSNYDIRLAKCIHKQLTSNFKLPDMGAREANFYVIKRCSMPAVLMELGFISNKKEEKVISGNWFQNKAMDLTAAGIKDYFK